MLDSLTFCPFAPESRNVPGFATQQDGGSPGMPGTPFPVTSTSLGESALDLLRGVREHEDDSTGASAQM